MQPTPIPDPDLGTVEEVHPVFPWLTAPVRAWFYRMAVSVSILAGGYGVIDGNKAALWVGFVAAFLGSGTAVAHTPTKS